MIYSDDGRPTFQTPYMRHILPREKHDMTDTQTETQGYRSAQQQIQELLQAGQRLDAFRRGYYESGYPVDYGNDPDPDILMDPTRSTGFDPVDIRPLADSVAERLNQQTQENVEKLKKKLKPKAKKVDESESIDSDSEE